MPSRNLARLALWAALLAGIVAALHHHEQFSVAAVQHWTENAGAAAPLIFLAAYAAAAVLFLPGSVLTIAGGALFGPVWGSFYSLTGATAGATLAFLVARYVASDWVARKMGGRLKQLIEGVEAEGWPGREAAAGSEGSIRNGLLALGLLALIVFFPRPVRRMRRAPMPE